MDFPPGFCYTLSIPYKITVKPGFLNVQTAAKKGALTLDLSRITRIMEDYKARGYYPSAVCQVFDKDSALYHRAFGEAAPESWFDLASVSKLLCTVMVLFAMEEGLLSPEDRLLDHLPGEKVGPAARERLADTTIAQVMTHTSGILAWYPFYTDGGDFYAVLDRLMGTTAPEEGMVYSDLNFMLMGEVFTHATGLTLREGLERYFRQRLGIRDISYGPVEPALCVPGSRGNRIEKRMCAERGLSFDGWRPDGAPNRGDCNDGNAYYYWGQCSGHAGAFANSGALAKLGQFLLTTQSPVFLRAMTQSVCGRGLGFDLRDPFAPGCGHSGFTGTSLWVCREAGVGAVILTNKYDCPEGQEPGPSNEFRRAVHKAVLEQAGQR